MKDKQYRPRLTEEEYQVVLAMKQGWRPDMADIPQIESASKKSPAKILIFDIETAPLRSYTWGLWKQNVPKVITDWFMLTWSAKWLFEDKVMSARLTGEEAIEEDDRRITEGIWRLINEADIVIAHNANKFDIKKLNTRFLMHGINPPMPYQVIDTLDVARKKFGFKSNRLDSINEQLGIGRKIKTDFSLWEGCMKGDDNSLMDMENYNIQDVVVLEELYLKLRPWITPHPNIGLFIEDEVERCPSCGSSHIKFEGTPYRTSVNSFQSFRCESCGSVGRSRKSMAKTDDAPKVQMTSVAR